MANQFLNRKMRSLRNTIVMVSFALIGLTAGALGGYVGYSIGIVGKSPLTSLKGDANDSPFDRTYRGMARLGSLEISARRCNGRAVSPEIIKRERQVIEEIQTSSTEAKLAPPLDVARAIVAYRSAESADLRFDKQASDYARHQETSFLRSAGWKDVSPTHFAAIMHELDNCPEQAIPKEKQ
jgi:hypothetical protein